MVSDTSNIGFNSDTNYTKIVCYPLVVNNNDKNLGGFAIEDEYNFNVNTNGKVVTIYAMMNYDEVMSGTETPYYQQREYGEKLLYKINMRDGEFGIIYKKMKPGTMSIECVYNDIDKNIYDTYIQYLDNPYVKENMIAVRRDNAIDKLI